MAISCQTVKAFASGRYEEACDLFWEMTAADEFQEFLTLPAYERISAEAA